MGSNWSKRGFLGAAFLPCITIMGCITGCDAGELISDSGVTNPPSTNSNDSEDDRDVLFSTLLDDTDQDDTNQDADQDGIVDSDDDCGDTPEGEEADEFGCSCSQRDSDDDGVNDCIDECPNNPRKIQVGATITCNVSFDDPGQALSEYYAPIELNLETACDAWAQHLSAVRDVTIEVEVRFSGIATAVASSKTVARVRSDNGVDTYEQGALAEIRTGVDPNDDEPDAVVTIGQSNLTGGLWWFDPNPAIRQAALPDDRIDAYSAFLHEMGHILAYNGWRDFQDGELPGNFLSTFDEQIIFDGTDFFFAGQNAVEAYGSPVPLTYGNIAHVANNAPRPGSDLIEELMNGVVTRRGKRRDISSIDLAVLTDIGAPMRAQAILQDGCSDAPAATRPAPELIVGPPPPAQERPLPPQQYQRKGQHCGCSH